MRRLLTASALFALAVCVTGASGQPPAKLDPQVKWFVERLDKKRGRHSAEGACSQPTSGPGA